MTTAHRVLSLLCLVVVPLTAEGRSLSMDDAVAEGLRRNPTYRQAHAEVERTRGSRLDAEPWFPANPVVGFSGGPREPSQGDRKFSYEAFVEQPVDVGGQRGKRLESADARISLSQARLATAEAEVRVRVRTAYVRALVASQNLNFAEQRITTAANLYEVARARVQGGASSEIDLQLATADLGRARAEGLLASAAVEAERFALSALLDLPPGERIELTTPLVAPIVRTEPVEGLVALALERKRDLVALRREGHAIDADIARLRAERIPPVALSLRWEQDTPSESWIGPGITVAAPIWRRNQGALAEATAERMRSQINLEASETATERDLRLAVATATLRRQELNLLGEVVLRASERARALAFEGWQAGKFDIFRPLAAELELVRARQAYLGAISALWTAEGEIDRALGLAPDKSSAPEEIGEPTK